MYVGTGINMLNINIQENKIVINESTNENDIELMVKHFKRKSIFI